MTAGPYDVAIVGASIAGCTAARLFAQRGARVALIEKRPDLDAHKTACTHYIQSSAGPTIERIGLAPVLEGLGAVRNSVEVHVPGTGWIRPPDDAPHGYSITRRSLDPALRRLAVETPGVDFLGGRTVTGLIGDGRPAGVLARDRSGRTVRVDARLVVGADGRGSAVARLARMPGRVRPNARFAYWAYWEGLEPGRTRSRMWLTEPAAAYTFPNEGGLTLILVAALRTHLPAFRADRHGAYRRWLEAMPDAPDVSGARMVSPILGQLDLPNVYRPPARPGVALVGDAALCSDPVPGVGCGWAFQSAGWLVDATAPALDGGAAALDSALTRYRRAHRRRLFAHHAMIADFSTGRPPNRLERGVFRAAARDPVVAAAVERVSSRNVSPLRLLGPRTLARVARANARAAA